MKAGKILAGVLVAIGVVAFLSVIIVKEVNQAIILQFGDPKRIIMKPGLNFKIPFIQNVVYLDKRILNLDAPPEEVIASDQKMRLKLMLTMLFQEPEEKHKRSYKQQRLIKKRLLLKLRVRLVDS